ncbi:MAG TPA: hypothetical protein PLI51_04800 [bacterium]|nr:hypothetical protein [bacterium]
MSIARLRAAGTTGWSWSLTRAEAPSTDCYGSVLDNENSFSGQSDYALQPAAVRFTSLSEPLDIREGDYVTVTYDGGNVLDVYPPPLAGSVDVYYYIGEDGSTFVDRWLCQRAQNPPSPTPTPSPTATPSGTPTPSPTCTPTLTPAQSPTPLQPAILLVKTAGDAPDGGTCIVRTCFDTEFHYRVTNTGNTYLSDIEVWDDNGTPDDPGDDFLVGVIPGPLAPGEHGELNYSLAVGVRHFNTAVAVGNPTDAAGADIPGLDDVSDSDSALALAWIVVDGNDYDGNGVTDAVLYRCGTSLWSIHHCPCNLSERIYFGESGDVAAPGDYDGDGSTDTAVFRPSTGLWAVRGLTRVYFGSLEDIPIPADFTGDGLTDIGVFRPSTGLWVIRGLTRFYFGNNGDLPVPLDATGSGRDQFTIFRAESGKWALRGVTQGYFGQAGDYPAVADYDGDGREEIGIFRPDSGLWAIKSLTRAYFGHYGDWPQPANYKLYGRAAQIGIWRPTVGLWAVRNTSRIYYGKEADVPITY